MKPKDFEHNVFINCPFDSPYEELLKPLLFTVHYCGFNPRIASERLDSGEVRLDKIKELIFESRYGIHDLSRCKSNKKGEFARFNLPFELGYDLSVRDNGRLEYLREKKILILEEEQYSLKKALSDMSFADTRHHNNEPEEMVHIVRT